MALLNCLPRFLENRFLGLDYVYSVLAWYICLNCNKFVNHFNHLYQCYELKEKKVVKMSQSIEFYQLVIILKVLKPFLISQTVLLLNQRKNKNQYVCVMSM